MFKKPTVERSPQLFLLRIINMQRADAANLNRARVRVEHISRWRRDAAETFSVPTLCRWAPRAVEKFPAKVQGRGKPPKGTSC